MNIPKTKKFSERIAKAFYGEYFLRVRRSADGNAEVIAMIAKLDQLVSTAKRVPNVIWLQSSRLMGSPNDLKLLLTEESKRNLELSDELAKVIEYDLTHPLTLKSIESSQEREVWGFDEDGNLRKMKRRSYKDLYEGELQSIDTEKKRKREDKENSLPNLDLLKKISHELQKNPNCFDIFLTSGTANTLRDFRVNTEQRRPSTTKNLIDRVKNCQDQGSFLNITDMNSDGNKARTATSKPRNAIEFPAEFPELKNVFWVKKEVGDSSGAINFLSKYWKLNGKTFSQDAIRREIARAEDCAPKQLAVNKSKTQKSLHRVAEKNDLSLEPQSPRSMVADYDGPSF